MFVGSTELCMHGVHTKSLRKKILHCVLGNMCSPKAPWTCCAASRTECMTAFGPWSECFSTWSLSRMGVRVGVEMTCLARLQHVLYFGSLMISRVCHDHTVVLLCSRPTLTGPSALFEHVCYAEWWTCATAVLRELQNQADEVPTTG